MRKLTSQEILNLKELTKNSIEFTIIEPTATGLNKSTLDATGPVRTYFKEQKIHDYGSQKQGQQHKEWLNGKLLTADSIVDSKVSLYRPTSKQGDPRIWFKNLKYVSSANDILAITYFDSVLFVINVTKLDVRTLVASTINNPVKELIKEISADSNLVSNELLALLKIISAKGPIPALLNADTAIGRTLESLLNIDINCSKLPDYKGIELKAFRSKRNNRKSLFAQVPDWSISKFKSSDQILDNFGYPAGDNFQLNCTISSLSRNPNSLILRLSEDLELLYENSNKGDIGDFAAWKIEVLHSRLLEKHNETFWISADSSFVDGQECFHYKIVEHTKKPIISQFDLLLTQGLITLDHIIKRKPGGRAKERGPIFKIRSTALSLLFPPSKTYDLLSMP